MESPRFKRFAAANHVVLINRALPSQPGLSFVGIDDNRAARELAHAMLRGGGGAGEIGVIHGPLFSHTSAERMRGVMEVYQQHGQALLLAHVVPSSRGARHRVWPLPSAIGSMALRVGGGAVLALQSGLHNFDFVSGELTLIAHPEAAQPQARLNDGKVDRQGRFVVGSMDTGEEAPIGSLYRLGSDGAVQTLARGFAICNGPCWNADGSRLTMADSVARKIYSFDYGDAGVSNQQVLVDLAHLAGATGFPDGATIDAEGCLWFAEVFGGRIWRISPHGETLRCIDFPVLKVTSLAFGGPDLDMLFVTSMARPPLPKYPEDGPLGGSLFVVLGLGVRGLAERRFELG